MGLICCCCSIAIIAVLGSIITTVTILHFVRHLKPINYQVTSASLTQFDLSTANQTLDYNLALNLTVRNPNKKLSVSYDSIKASASFKSQSLNSVTFNSFKLGKGEKVVFPASFTGQQSSVSLPADEVAKFQNNPTDFDILLTLDPTLTDKDLPKKIKRTTHKMECNLKVPLKSNEFKVTDCKSTKK